MTFRASAAQIKYAQAVERVSGFLHNAKAQTLYPRVWEETYKELQAVARFWGVPHEASWDKVVRESGEKWIAEARKDKAFKEYYKLRKEADKLEVLVK